MSSKAQSEKGSGTAARTRPLSIQEILLRREKKAAAEAKKAAATGANKTKDELKDNEKGKPNHSESGRGHKSRKDLKDVPVEGSRKESIRDAPREDSKKDDVRHMSSKEGSKKDKPSKKENLKDRPKDGSKMDDLTDAPNKGSKKERSNVRDDGQSAGRDKDARSSHKLSTSTRGRPAESKDGNHGGIRARNGDATRSEYLKGPVKRWDGEPVLNDRIKERSDMLRNEAKRKNRGFDDQRRPDVDLPVLKKHDSARFQVFKHYGRNDGRREYGKPYHEEPRSKRRRSRSRKRDQGRRDRSLAVPKGTKAWVPWT